MYFEVFVERDIIRKKLIKNTISSYIKNFLLSIDVDKNMTQDLDHLVNINEFNIDLVGQRFNFEKEVENIRVSDNFTLMYYITLRRRFFNDFLFFQSLIMNIGYYARFNYTKLVYLNDTVKLYLLEDKNIFNKMEGDLGFKDKMFVDFNVRGEGNICYSMHYYIRYLRLKLVKNDKKYIKR